LARVFYSMRAYFLMALFGPHALSELSPGCAPKRTSAYDGFTPWLRDENTSPLIR
jgi:hypothetical protein